SSPPESERRGLRARGRSGAHRDPLDPFRARHARPRLQSAALAAGGLAARRVASATGWCVRGYHAAARRGGPQAAPGGSQRRQRAAGSIEATERAHLTMRTALLLSDPLEQEQLLSEALADNPGDAAAIALHARLVTQRDPGSAAERFIALGEALETHAPDEAAAHYLEAGVWHERAGGRAEAAALAQRALKLVPKH